MSDAPSPQPWPHRFLRTLLAVPLAVWMVLEEWIWDRLTAAMVWAARLRPIHWLETRIARLPPIAAMAMYVVPWLVLLPAKVLGLWLIGSGRAVSGILVFVLAKVVGTALLAWLFKLTRAALLTIGWFRRFYFWFTGWRDRIYAYVRSLRAWQQARQWLAQARATLRAWRVALLGR